LRGGRKIKSVEQTSAWGWFVDVMIEEVLYSILSAIPREETEDNCQSRGVGKYGGVKDLTDLRGVHRNVVGRHIPRYQISRLNGRCICP
jgi:hypothetical protein